MTIKLTSKISEKEIKKFSKFAMQLIMDEVTDTDDENKQVIAAFTARDMAIGARLTKGKNIIIGATIGAIGTLAVTESIKKFKNRNKEEDLEGNKVDSETFHAGYTSGYNNGYKQGRVDEKCGITPNFTED